MDDDLNDEGYRGIYTLTFVFIFCIVPLVFILANADLNRKERQYPCDQPLEVTEVIREEDSTAGVEPNEYLLVDGFKFTSTVKYTVGDQVCRY